MPICSSIAGARPYRLVAATLALAVLSACSAQGEGKTTADSASGAGGRRAAAAAPKRTSPVAAVVLARTPVTETVNGEVVGGIYGGADTARGAADGTHADSGAAPARDTLKAAGNRDSIRYAARWAARRVPAPAEGSLVPGNRIVAFYGNPLSKKMGILGELPPEQMLARLEQQAKEWAAADTSMPVVKALEVIGVVAQGAPGRDGKHRLRMDSALIEKVYGWAKQANAQLIIDIQVGTSTPQDEIRWLERFLVRPDVHLAIDPEFDMRKAQVVPGRKIGTTDASDINWAIDYLAALVKKHGLPPKMLVVHRFTRNMLTNASAIEPDPLVPVIIQMDGWGAPWLKRATYRQYILPEPVQYTGFKLFYHNDTKKGDPLMRPADVLKIFPRPIFIQYQ